ncbi:PREDICTED: E3 ubiquitin-protein ligase RNF146-like [Amphimedon queenslandica]|uniref:E3 ubiquitin-protein ligase n=1 Tax=Amphimedon queenslandica TaxID=400682 RepID=A0A1X7VQD4_AMPQE|nr:PREDICTED: E3 ubiquitin-protein ligase RNF146-like [Amphimedon queenslandica]|eukprot:XP_003383131.1 PREDICTED: E3 ubiquitin-protein ligase RNF146-like [Amphimedon queenslandica]
MADSENSKKGQYGDSKSLEEKEKKRKSESLDKEGDRVVQVEKDLSKLKIKEDIVPFDMKCPICQDKSRHPLTLPCGHTFCYLCIKGVYARQKVCALCRQAIPQHCIVSPPGTGEREEEEGRKTCWYYEAKSGGWWEYEERVRQELEIHYQSLQINNEDNQDDGQFVIYVSGFPYVVDFAKMIQYRQDKPNRSRRIKREKGVAEEGEELVRGVAGIPIAPSIRQDDN